MPTPSQPEHLHFLCCCLFALFFSNPRALAARAARQTSAQAPGPVGSQANHGGHASAAEESDRRAGAAAHHQSPLARADSGADAAPGAAWGQALLQNATTFMGLNKRDKRDAKGGELKGRATEAAAKAAAAKAVPGQRSLGWKAGEKGGVEGGRGVALADQIGERLGGGDAVLPVDIALTLGAPANGEVEGGGPASHRLPRLSSLLLHLQSALWATGAAALWAKHERLRMQLLSGHWAKTRGAIEAPPLPASALYEEGVRCLVTMAGHLARTAESLLESIASLPAAQSNRLLHFGAPEAIEGASAHWEGLSRSLRELCVRLKLRSGAERVAGRYLGDDVAPNDGDGAWPSVSEKW